MCCLFHTDLFSNSQRVRDATPSTGNSILTSFRPIWSLSWSVMPFMRHSLITDLPSMPCNGSPCTINLTWQACATAIFLCPFHWTSNNRTMWETGYGHTRSHTPYFMHENELSVLIVRASFLFLYISIDRAHCVDDWMCRFSHQSSRLKQAPNGVSQNTPEMENAACSTPACTATSGTHTYIAA